MHNLNYNFPFNKNEKYCFKNHKNIGDIYIKILFCNVNNKAFFL